MSSTIDKLNRVWSVVLGIVVFGLSPSMHGQSLIPIDISAFANTSWTIFDGGNTLPTGHQTYHGVPFNIPSGDQNAIIAFGDGILSATIPINVLNATKVYTLMDTVWGQGGPTSYVSVTFNGSAGATATFALVGNRDIRDFNQPSSFTSMINNSSTINAFTGPIYGSSGCAGTSCYHVLDEQIFALPADFSTQTLTSVTITDRGADDFQRIILAALTVNGTPGPAGPTVSNVFDQAAATANLTAGMPIQVVGTGFGNSSTDDATVTIGTEAAPVLTFINSTNLIVQVPVDIPVGPTTLTVTYKGQTSAAFNIKIVALAPEIEPFQSSTGSPFYDASGNPITTAHPAIPNTEVYCLAIGLGTTNPAQVTNTVATAQAPTTLQVQVNVGNKIVQPDYAGLFVGGTPGFYQIKFKVPADVTLGNVPVTLLIGGLTSNAQTLLVAAPIPVINAIVNGASFNNGPQAGNSFVSLFGLNFGSKNTDGNIFPAKTFNGLSIEVNGTEIPLYVVAATGGQINIVLPSELGISGNASVVVKTADGTSAAFELALSADAVGIFRITDPAKPTRHNGAVLFTNTAWKVMPLSMAKALQLPDCASVTTASICGKPAKAKDQIEIYLTGLGKATPNGNPNGAVLATGSLAPTDGSVLYKTVETPVVKIGGLQAVVSFSGIAPGNAGQYQINAQVPDGVKAGDDVTLEITMPDGSTDTVTIAIAS